MMDSEAGMQFYWLNKMNKRDMKFYINILTTLLVGIMIFSAPVELYAQDTDLSGLVQKAQSSGIDKQTLDELQNRAEKRGVDNQQLGRIIQTAIVMSEERLPADVAIQKALEGFSKGIPAARIVSVVDQVHQSVGQAAKVVDPWMQKSGVKKMVKQSGQPELQFRNELARATSKSFMQKIPGDAVKKVLNEIGSESVLNKTGPSDIVAAMGIFPDLPSAAEQSDVSGKFIVRALKQGFKADDLQKLPSAIKVAQQRSQLPAASVIEGVAGQMHGNIPAKQILQNLFDGKVGGGPPGGTPPGLKNNKGRGHSNGN